jgi:hypothetical protein
LRLICSCSFSTLTVSYSLDINARVEVWSSVTFVDVSSSSATTEGVTKEEVSTILAKEGVITSAALYTVSTILAKEGVITSATNDAVIANAAREEVTTIAAIDEVITSATNDGVMARTTADNVISA